MQMQIKTLKKEQCLKIAQILNPKVTDTNDLLLWLPDYVFSQVFDVAYTDGDFHVYAGTENVDCWCIPPYFVDEIARFI